MINWPCFGPVTAHHSGLRGRAKHSPHIKEMEKSKRKGWASHSPLQGHTPSDLKMSYKALPLKGSVISQWHQTED
jgi:hypothetical protein